MDYRTLGRTGLEVSRLSLGSGGPNRFGQSRYASRDRIRDLVHRALDLGINFFDTAHGYGESETLLGSALRNVPRDRYLLATKVLPWSGGACLEPDRLVEQFETGLSRLGVDHVDLYQLHRVPAARYPAVMDRLQPAMERLRAQGKVRYFGITESSAGDPGHEMLQLAVRDGFFDTLMVAYHPGNRSAEESVLPAARARNLGVIGMAVARHMVPRSYGQRLAVLARSLASLASSPPTRDMLRKRLFGVANTLRGPGPGAMDLSRHEVLATLRLPQAAYTFAASNPDIATVLTGTNDPEHLESNAQAVMDAPLSKAQIERLVRVLSTR